MEGQKRLQMNMGVRCLDRLLRPKSLVVVGGETAVRAVNASRAHGFMGEIFAVHPRRTVLEGATCYPSIDALPEVPDAAFVGVNRDAAIEIVAQLSEIGVGGAVVHAAGFSETGPLGESHAVRLTEAAETMPVVGPNCLGLINYLDGVALWSDFDGGQSVERGIVLLTQSGSIALNVTSQTRALPMAMIINVGNQLIVDVGDFIDALVDDERVSVIALHLEGVADIGSLDRSLRKAKQARKPVVILKSGKSPMGRALVMTHTASLTGSDDVFKAFSERSGAVVVSSISELLETAKLLDMFGPLKGTDVTAIAYSGGEASLMADAAVDTPIQFPSFTAEDVERIRPTISDLVTISNPFDIHTFDWANGARLAPTLEATAEAKADVVMLLVTLPKEGVVDHSEWWVIIEAFARAIKASGKPGIMASQMAEGLPEYVALRARELGLLTIADLDDAYTAIAKAAEVSRQFDKPVASPLKGHDALSGGREVLNEWEAKRFLDAAGMCVPEGRLVSTVDAAEEAASELGGDVAMKAIGRDILHKTEMNAVRLRLQGSSMIRSAAADLLPMGEAVLVERMVAHAVGEFILGITHDSICGPHLLLGSGGVLTELLHDRRILLFPFTREDVLDAVRSLRSFPLIDGFRGKPKGDVDALVDAVMALQSVVSNSKRFHDIEINPLVVCAEGEGAYAVDAVAVLACPEQETPGENP